MKTFAVSIKKITNKPPFLLELALTRLGPEPMDLWPELALRLLADPEGSPLREEPGFEEALYEEAWLEENAARFVENVELLKLKGAEASYRVTLADPALAKALKKGMAWESEHRPTREPRILGGAWARDGKAVLIAYSQGLARLVGVTKKGLGTPKAFLHHPGLLAVAGLPEGLATVGGALVRIWEPKGKGVIATHELPSPATAACVLGDRLVVGMEDGAIEILGEGPLEVPGVAAVTALAAHGDRISASFADGSLRTWSEDGALLGSEQEEAEVTALAYTAEGQRMVARADGSLEAGEERGSLPEARLHFLRPSLSSDHKELFVDAQEGFLVTLDPQSGEVTSRVVAPDPLVLQHSPSGRYRAALMLYPRRLLLWSAEGRLLRTIAGLPIREISFNYHPQRAVTFSPSERLIAVHHQDEGYKSGAIHVFEVEGGGGITLPNANRSYAWVQDLVWLDEDRILVRYANEKDKLWTLSSQSYEELELKGRPEQFLLTDRGVAACDRESLRILSPEDLSEVAVLPAKGLFGSSYPPSAQVSRDGRTALLYNPFQDLAVLREGKDPWVLKKSRDTFQEVQLSPSGELLLVLSKDKEVELWEVATRSKIASVELDGYRFFFAPDEASVTCVTVDGVHTLSRDGALSRRLAAADLPRAPERVERAYGLPDKEPIFATAAGRRICLTPGRGGARYGGYKIASPDGARTLTLWGYGAEVHITKWM